jgi:hypothetical protein
MVKVPPVERPHELLPHDSVHALDPSIEANDPVPGVVDGSRPQPALSARVEVREDFIERHG